MFTRFFCVCVCSFVGCTLYARYPSYVLDASKMSSLVNVSPAYRFCQLEALSCCCVVLFVWDLGGLFSVVVVVVNLS